jgi:hypothetical protein
MYYRMKSGTDIWCNSYQEIISCSLFPLKMETPLVFQ